MCISNDRRNQELMTIKMHKLVQGTETHQRETKGRIQLAKERRKQNQDSILKYLILVIRNPETLTLPSTENLHTPALSITLGTNLPELSLTPVLRNPNIAVGVDAAIAPARRVDKDSNLVVAVKGYTVRGVPARHVDVLVAKVVDGVSNAPILFDAAEVHELIVDLGICEDGGDEEEGAQGCEEHCEAGATDHYWVCSIVCR